MSLFWDLYSFAQEQKKPFLLDKIISFHKYFYEKERERVLTYKPNLIMPKTMCEKILWLMTHGDLSLKTLLTDKIEVKKWVSNIIGEKYVAKTYAICDDLSEVDWDTIPDKFAIKASHGCRMNVFVQNKEQFMKFLYPKAIETTKYWLNINYSDFCGEIQYKNIPRKLLIEELTVEDKVSTRIDYSFHCFNGKIEFIEHNFISKKDATGFIFDRNGEQLDFVFSGDYTKKEFEIPPEFEKMREVAEELAKDFRYVRVDLRATKDSFIFGEMTFTPYAGTIPFSDKKYDLELGKKIIL